MREGGSRRGERRKEGRESKYKRSRERERKREMSEKEMEGVEDGNGKVLEIGWREREGGRKTGGVG